MILHQTFLICTASLNKYFIAIISSYTTYLLFLLLWWYYNKPLLHTPLSQNGLVGSFIKHSWLVWQPITCILWQSSIVNYNICLYSISLLHRKVAEEPWFSETDKAREVTDVHCDYITWYKNICWYVALNCTILYWLLLVPLQFSVIY